MERWWNGNSRRRVDIEAFFALKMLDGCDKFSISRAQYKWIARRLA
jgi:hypothetical protein